MSKELGQLTSKFAKELIVLVKKQIKAEVLKIKAQAKKAKKQ